TSFRFSESGDGTPKVAFNRTGARWIPAGFRSLAPREAWEILRDVGPEQVWIEGLLSSRTVELLEWHTRENYKDLIAHKRYDMEVLSRVKDFRTLTNLHYVLKLSRRMGIGTALDPVLSFPLGANAISILEAALAYQVMMTGQAYPLEREAMPSMTPVIRKIADRQGRIIWEYAPRPERVLSDRISDAVCEILRMVMLRGTGAKARDAVQLSLQIDDRKMGIPIPCFGKTGTANRYTNSSFVGFVPGPKKEGGELSTQEGYVIAAYVGYDDNRPMKGKNTVIYGSSGALPLWIDTANAVVNGPAFRDRLDIADLAFDGSSDLLHRERDGLAPVVVSPITGLVAEQDDAAARGSAPRVWAEINRQGNDLALRRVFEPVHGVRNAPAP
ncbi:MAG: hypothetical protein JW821_12090, partial [Deltaproteobacteria bacterium]|nr:hypothetical protein [Deltaproteobacteria bacterium]